MRVGVESRDEADEEERRGKADDAVGETFKLHQIVIDRDALLEFEEGIVGIILVGQCKAGL